MKLGGRKQNHTQVRCPK